jgi:hypothetical protein
MKTQNNIFWFVVVGALLILFGVSILFFIMAKKSSNQSYRFSGVIIGEKRYSLDVADSDAERKKGLGDRDSLCEECGMLFVFEQPGQYAFWMKDMRFPLDIIWLLGDEVVFVAHNVQLDFLGILDPVVSADRVIEINAGAASNFNAGERVKFLR